jgi:protease I
MYRITGKLQHMNDKKLRDLRVAVLVAEGFEEVEMTKPRAALDEAGAQTVLISPERDTVQAFNHHDKGRRYQVDVRLDDAEPDDYDALLLPGGALNPDTLRTLPTAVAFVRSFFDEGKPVAAICHAPWTLIEADVVEGRRVTSWPSVQTDLRNAGATWVDASVVRDDNLVTSRKPDDIPDFNRTMIEVFAEAAPVEAQ